MSCSKFKSCPQCGYKIEGFKIKCPRCNKVLLKKCSECNGCKLNIKDFKKK